MFKIFKSKFTLLTETPQKLFLYSLLAIIGSFLSMFSIIVFASVLQIFTYKIGFIQSSNIDSFIPRIFYSNDFLFSITIIFSIFFNYFSLFLDNFLNILAKEKFIYEIKKIYFNKIFYSNNISLGKTSSFVSDILPRAGEFYSSIISVINKFILIIFLSVFIFIEIPKEFSLFIIFLVLIFIPIYFLKKKLVKLSIKILNFSNTYNKQVTDSIKNILYIKIIGQEIFFKTT